MYAPGTASGSRQMSWEERFAYYKAKMSVLRTYGGHGKCGICFHKRKLVLLHGNKTTATCAACPDCVALVSFRSRALKRGQDPACPFCRKNYQERTLLAPEALAEHGGNCG